MNLPEPSGSSPPENPPGIKIICDSFIFFAKYSTDSETFDADKLFITIISVCAPARSNAFAESYSQLVPGNTGISTLGFSHFIIAGAAFLSSYENAGISFFDSSDFVGYTFSLHPDLKEKHNR